MFNKTQISPFINGIFEIDKKKEKKMLFPFNKKMNHENVSKINKFNQSSFSI